MGLKSSLLLVCSIVLVGVVLLDYRRYQNTPRLGSSSSTILPPTTSHYEIPPHSSVADSVNSPLRVLSQRAPVDTAVLAGDDLSLPAAHADHEGLLSGMSPGDANIHDVIRTHEEKENFLNVMIREKLELRTGDIIALKSHGVNVVSVSFPVPRGGETPGLSVNHREPMPEVYSQFTVVVVGPQEIALTMGQGHFLALSCCEKKYDTVSLVSGGLSSALNFTVIVTDIPGVIQLRVSHGKYLIPPSHNAGPLVLARPNNARSTLFAIKRLYNAPNGLYLNYGLSLYSGDVIAIRTINETYWKRYAPFPRAGMSGIVAYRKLLDPFSLIKVEVMGPNEMHLVAENKRYLKRYCCWRGESVMATYLTSPDAFSKFTVVPVGGRQVQLMAENNEFWSMMDAGHGFTVPFTSPIRSLMTQNFYISLLTSRSVLASRPIFLSPGQKIALSIVGDGRFLESLSPYPDGPADSGLVPSEMKKPEEHAVFIVHPLSPSQVYLQTNVHEGGYWRWSCNGRHFYVSTDSKQPDSLLSPFFFFPVADDRVLVRGPNGDYLTVSQTPEGKPVIATSTEPGDALTFVIHMID